MSDDVGVAIRVEDGCGTLQKCGNAGQNFVSCCPEDTVCKSANDNTYCCADDDDDCAPDLDEEPRCADTDWGLYNNHYWDGTPGYFCCAGDYRGYNQTSAFSNGCAESDTRLEDNEEWLPLVEQTIPSSTDSATTTSTSETATATSEPDDGGGGTNAGAIAGGVVGGVAGLAIIGAAAWWFLRRRRRGAAPSEGGGPAGAGFAKSELDATPPLRSPEGPPRELDAQPTKPPSELPA